MSSDDTDPIPSKNSTVSTSSSGEGFSAIFKSHWDGAIADVKEGKILNAFGNLFTAAPAAVIEPAVHTVVQKVKGTTEDVTHDVVQGVENHAVGIAEVGGVGFVGIAAFLALLFFIFTKLNKIPFI